MGRGWHQQCATFWTDNTLNSQNPQPRGTPVPSMQQAPDIEPELSSGAKKLRKRKLNGLPWAHSGRHPGSPLFWYVILMMIRTAWDYIFRRKQVDPLPPSGGGRIFTSIHINGLVDPLSIVHNQDSRVITMGRHDLMTMPLIGWLTRRMGAQPVIRKPEIDGGVSDEEYARSINHRTLLTMTHCIAAGHNAVVMPEGKSHQDSRLHRFKTGTMRLAFNATAIADERGLVRPVLQPVGLHYRCHHWFRTDVYVEFAEPIPIESSRPSQNGRRLLDGKWVEPLSEDVIQLRETLFEGLSTITPDAPDWEAYRAWHLLGHLRANASGSPLTTLRDEVLAAREVRELLRSSPNDSLIDSAREAARIFYDNELDASSLDALSLKTQSAWASGLTGLLIMILTAPITLPSTGIQAFFAWYLGNRTDEGVDARTTYHMLAAMFSPVLVWPPIALAIAYLALGLTWMVPITTIGIMLGFHISNLFFLRGYDLWTDFTASRRRAKLASSANGARIVELLEMTRSNLNVLK